MWMWFISSIHLYNRDDLAKTMRVLGKLTASRNGYPLLIHLNNCRNTKVVNHKTGCNKLEIFE